ncbi:hypothetical protein HYFRA_00006166 [Hymenoscyphus fraxineus]|uniref:Uncharacterized protein n=1 Tax=Hymenoscyphus fraxineus TaxID=746836 RepID=A0A9N9L9N1_9HELO|nr:hypothetical protein HYFRA_00006166 [Hymenoscyphus fraxineus]
MALVNRNGNSKRPLEARNTDDGPKSDAEYCAKACTSPALTTSWAEPSSCVNYWTPVTSRSYDFVELTRNLTVDGCLPSLTTPAACSDCPAWVWPTAFSPGICPSDYPAPATSIYDDITTLYCCPRNATGYTQTLGTNRAITGVCSGRIASGFITIEFNSSVFLTTLITTSERLRSAGGSLSIVSWLTNATVTTSALVTTTIPAYGGVIYVEPLEVKFKSGDITISSSSTAAPQASATTTMPIASSLPPPIAISNSPELSAGAKAGIGVAVSLCVIAFAALGFFFWGHRRNSQRIVEDQWGRTERRSELSNEPMQVKELPSPIGERHPVEMGGGFER